MKNLILRFAVVVTILASCNSNSNNPSDKHGSLNRPVSYSRNENSGTSTTKDEIDIFSIKEIVSQYMRISKGLADDNGNDAASGGKALVVSIDKTRTVSLTTENLKIWADISADAKEMAEHIGENPDNIGHQREHFVILSKDIYDLVKTFGSDQVLYKVFDSMSNEGKGGFWLSETKEFKNPYMGKAMLTSGSIQEEIRKK